MKEIMIRSGDCFVSLSGGVSEWVAVSERSRDTNRGLFRIAEWGIVRVAASE